MPMQLKSLEVTGLLGSDRPVTLDFTSGLNILTGRNGSGKTSLLKLLWYIVSGNILLALKEVPFKKAVLETTAYTCTVFRTSSINCRIVYLEDGEEFVFEDVTDDDGDVIVNAEDEADERLQAIGASVFLPTFRRIEGGFSLNRVESASPSLSQRSNLVNRARSSIEDSLLDVSRRLSHQSHIFVAALSTADVVSLLVRQYTDASDEYNRLQQRVSQEVITKIREFKSDQSDASSLGAATRLLDDIRVQVEGMETAREAIMRPLEAVRGLVMKLFRIAGIRLNRNLSFGDAANAINSDALSAGEKQMLSFIAYNAFYKNAIIFIDEPELSLHVDWQRQLFPLLLDQQTSNQFVIATHSPFIYGKYPDKELQIDPSRGDEGD
jgi:predicted ATP-dependent endonuclease of OLD family